MNNIIKKYKEMSKPIKASLWFTICSVIQKIISLITVPIFTRILTTEQYGIYTLYLSWHDLIIIFTSLGLYNAIINKAMIKFEDDKNGVISSFVGITTILTIIVFVLFYVNADIATKITGLSLPMIIVLFVDLLFTPSLAFWMAKERFEFKYVKVILITLLIAVCNPLLGLIGVCLTDYKAEARIFSVALVNILSGVFFYFYFIIKGKKMFNWKYWKYALSFNLPLVPHYLSGAILNQSDRVMINYYCSSEDAAIYGVAYTIAMTAIIVVNAVNASMTPWVFKTLSKNNDDIGNSIEKVMNESLVLILLIVVLLILFAPEVLMIMGGTEYIKAIWVFPFVAGSVFFIYLYSRFADVEFYYDKNTYVLISSLFSALLNIVLNYIAIPMFGYVAAGITTFICYIVQSILNYIFMKKTIKSKGILRIYDVKFIVGISLFIVILCLISILLYYKFILRYLIICLIILYLVYKRKIFISLIKKKL